MPGGKRPGAGRKPGSPNKKTAAVQKAVADAGVTPLDFLLDVMRNKTHDLETRINAAKSAAPYVHAKLATVDMNHKGDVDLHVEIISYAEQEQADGEDSATP